MRGETKETQIHYAISKILIVSPGILMNNASAGDNVLGMCTLTNHSHKVSSNWNKKQASPPPNHQV